MLEPRTIVLTIEEASEYFEVSTKTIRRRIDAGKLEAYKIKGRLHVYVKDTKTMELLAEYQSEIALLKSKNDEFREKLGEIRERIAAPSAPTQYEMNKKIAKKEQERYARMERGE